MSGKIYTDFTDSDTDYTDFFIACRSGYSPAAVASRKNIREIRVLIREIRGRIAEQARTRQKREGHAPSARSYIASMSAIRTLLPSWREMTPAVFSWVKVRLTVSVVRPR